jgi:2-polyprenyl-3-methyl-5-hydroxy-6-metoxy-1,4-benzoquinol methylase
VIYGPKELDAFVETSDKFGGPGNHACEEFWRGFSYVPAYSVNQLLDPFSEEYVAEQLALYEEIANRRYDPHRDEMTSFDLDRHISAANPYDHPNPAVLALHLERLSRALRHASPRRGDVILDMGCGWGLSSELAAYLGLSVQAVDVNPSFVRLVSERARLRNQTINAQVSTFETFSLPYQADIALFYECFHHAVRPWTVASNIAVHLKPGGRVVLAGEPINDIWWNDWGLRLDALSVYCIHKFGWFESGWTLSFLDRVLRFAGFEPTAHPTSDTDVGYVVIGEKRPIQGMQGNQIAQEFVVSGAIIDTPWLILHGRGALTMSLPTPATGAVVTINNFCTRSLQVLIMNTSRCVFDGQMPPGWNTLVLSSDAGNVIDLRFEIEEWIPDNEIHNGDIRTVGLHVQRVDFY